RAAPGSGHTARRLTQPLRTRSRSRWRWSRPGRLTRRTPIRQARVATLRLHANSHSASATRLPRATVNVQSLARIGAAGPASKSRVGDDAVAWIGDVRAHVL